MLKGQQLVLLWAEAALAALSTECRGPSRPPQAAVCSRQGLESLALLVSEEALAAHHCCSRQEQLAAATKCHTLRRQE